MVRHLEDSVIIGAVPARVWDWLTHLSEHYREWHPDHVSAEWVRGEPNQMGSILEAVEYLGGTEERLRFATVLVDPPRRFEYRFQGPISALLPGGSFTIEPTDGGSRFTARLSYRFGRATEWVFRRRMALLQKHMREEGENLRRIIESSG